MSVSCIITVLFFMIDQWLTCNLSPRILLDVHKMWWRWHCQGTGWGVSRKTTRQLLVRITWQNLTKVKVIKISQHNKYHQVKQKINDCLHQKFHYMYLKLHQGPFGFATLKLIDLDVLDLIRHTSIPDLYV